MIGGLAAYLPNVLFAARVGGPNGNTSARRLLETFYVGEALKLISTALLFVFIFQLPNILFPSLFIGFISVIMVFWLALLLSN